MVHQYTGMAAYRRTVDIPILDPSRSLWLLVERVERSVKVLIDGQIVAEHTGYLSACEVDITAQSLKGDALNVTLLVNATRAIGYDGLVGEQDLITDGTDLGGWGGIGGHVWLESRARRWIQSPHVQSSLSAAFDSAKVTTTITVKGKDKENTNMALRATYKDAKGKLVGTCLTQCTSSLEVCGGSIRLDAVSVWSPASPFLYTVSLELIDASTTVIDTAEVSFGLRQLQIEGYHWKLNGLWLYLHGYGGSTTQSMPPS